MASPAKRLATNVEGDFFVDSTCIDCAACRWIAPATFDDEGDYSRVFAQPKTKEETKRALMAVLACPTASIGFTEEHDIKAAQEAYPDPVEEGARVYHCGYHAESSFGAASWLIARDAAEGGNILIDSPRFNMPLVRRIEALGGVKTLFLTHQDDVADHEKFRAHFGCERIIHADDGRSGDMERLIEGREPIALDRDVTLIPVPGHTRGSMCLLYRGKYLFTGDHLAWSPVRKQLYAFRDACWYSWREQLVSMRRLAEFRFEWVLPGHGHRAKVSDSNAEMAKCIAWMDKRS